MPRKMLSVLLLLAAALIAGAVVVNCSRPEQTKPAPPARQEQPLPKTKPLTHLSVDFANATLANIVPLVTEQTGKGFVLQGTEAKTISWTEYNIPREKLLDAFLVALSAHDLSARQDGNLYTITTREESKVLLKLDFATSTKGTFFLLGNTIYPQAQFPYPLKQDGGHWYALVPKSLSDQMTQPGDSRNHAQL